MSDDSRLHLAADRIEIQNVLGRYSRAIDRHDLDLLKSVYHPDAIDNHGGFNGNAHEFADMIIPYLQNNTVYTAHMMFQSQIEVEGDRATAETYFLAYHRMCGGRKAIMEFFGPTYTLRAQAAGTIDQDHEHMAGGRYIDQFLRRDGIWRIIERTLLNEWSQWNPLTSIDAEGGVAAWTVSGTRGNKDPIYRALAWLRE